MSRRAENSMLFINKVCLTELRELPKASYMDVEPVSYHLQQYDRWPALHAIRSSAANDTGALITFCRFTARFSASSFPFRPTHPSVMIRLCAHVCLSLRGSLRRLDHEPEVEGTGSYRYFLVIIPKALLKHSPYHSKALFNKLKKREKS